MKQLTTLLFWINSNALFVLSVFLIAFIPLFPKIPLFDILPGYIVRIRPEDFLIILGGLLWLRDLYNKKIVWNTTYFWMVSMYIASGIVSIILAVVLLETVPAQLLHIGKSVLHLFRYAEYFAVFFFAYSSIKTKNQLKTAILVLVLTVLAIVGYGFGQEYLHFPLYSTMNREYSKGTTLYLQEGARPQSTFAGHYDLAAYLVIVLPIIFSFALQTTFLSKKKLQLIPTTILLHLAHLAGAWMLVTSGSKTAFIAYCFGILFVVLSYLKEFGSLKQQLKWGSSLLVISTLFLVLLLNTYAKPTRDSLISLVEPKITTLISKVTGTTTSVTSSSNQSGRPEDVFGDGHEFTRVATISATGERIEMLIPTHSTWSANALKYGLSMGIRLDTLWPQALKGFVNNPLFGNGYATLSVLEKGQFTEADSTDNNYLRVLGETGLFGFMTFFGLLLIIIYELYRLSFDRLSAERTLQIGFIASCVGILINATYIDVFAASKVAFSFWLLAGLTLRVTKVAPSDSIEKIVRFIKQHISIILTLVLMLFILHKNPFVINTQIRDFAVSAQQIEQVSQARCFVSQWNLHTCRNSGEITPSKIYPYSILLIPFVAMYNNPGTYYFLNLFLVILSILTSYQMIKKLPKDTQFALLFLQVIGIYLSLIITQPFTTQQLVIVVFGLPVLIKAYVYVDTRIAQRYSKLLVYCMLFISLLAICTSKTLSELVINYRNTYVSQKFQIIDIANQYFDNNYVLEPDKKNYLITTLNPLYVDFYRSKRYDVLPLSSQQEYGDRAHTYWSLPLEKNTNLLENYVSILDKHNLFVTNYEIEKNDEYLSAFQEIKKVFQLQYKVIACNDTCNLYSVEKPSKKVSPIPSSVNQVPLDPSRLIKPYSFSVVSNLFGSKYTTKEFIQFLKTSKHTDFGFQFITGDYLSSPDKNWNTYFATEFADTVSYPILYNSGNYKYIEHKFFDSGYYSFFTDTEYYLVLDLETDSSIDINQRLFTYNKLLELEKMPNIKSLFVVAHNLDNNVQTSPDSFVVDLEKKLSQLSGIKKFVISTRDNTHIKPTIEQRNDITYISTLITNSQDDTFATFSIDATGSATFAIKHKGLDF